jgi:tetratricopeptide (TPR) repeat protein
VWEQPAEEARNALGVLLSRSMVLYDPAQQRWRLHDLMRDLAGGGAAAKSFGAPAGLADRLAAARRRHAEHYEGVLAATSGLYVRGGEHVLSALGLFDRERRNIETGQAWAAAGAADDPAAARLCVSYPDAGAYVLFLRQHPRKRIGWLEAAAAAARETGDRRGEGSALGGLGNAYADLGEPRRAIELYEQWLLIAREIGHRRGEGQAATSSAALPSNCNRPSLVRWSARAAMNSAADQCGLSTRNMPATRSANGRKPQSSAMRACSA